MTSRVAVFGIWSLLASLSLAIPSEATDLPDPANRAAFPTPGATSVLLGRDLFFDPILSGNRNIACATCHHPEMAGGDGVSLSLGEGGRGLGPARTRAADNPPKRLARNAPPLFNLGAAEFTAFTHDGRVSASKTERYGISLPEELLLERPVSLLAAQALLPLVAVDEMAGHPGENIIADAVAQGRIAGYDGAWQKIAERVWDIPEYRRRFAWLIGPDEPLHITHITAALADFVAYEFRATDSPFDAFLSGRDEALSNDQLRGMALFYGKAGCGGCHSGTFQTDHGFHAIGLPQIGPGKGHGANGNSDIGLGAITGDPGDAYKFRTPSLRNVALTAPYGHNGAYRDLAAIIRHHADPGAGLAQYPGLSAAYLPDVGADEAGLDGALSDEDEMLNIYAAATLPRTPLTDMEITALVDFLEALTDPVSRTGRLGVPDAVPSGLPVAGLPGDS
ncbi:Cytochrome c551 peroxidase precursor [Roseovarius sp. THAF27]|uniref:cytochrome-c peroxidase n=1 Tax=Roseovarius sp. THAF27 TaxID=2587850 RepID=UPI001267A6BC|nr:cytochrome c peroxidase [Roseovarius sp. THAF27]QFT80920.1 Cytochrome c551 peroxidase precursor [Roseovarius sp. THAF27]